MTGAATDRRYAILPPAAIDAIRAREAQIEGLRKGRLLKSSPGGIWAGCVGAGRTVRQTRRAHINVAGRNVEILLEMEIMGRKKVTVEDRTLMQNGHSQS